MFFRRWISLMLCLLIVETTVRPTVDVSAQAFARAVTTDSWTLSEALASRALSFRFMTSRRSPSVTPDRKVGLSLARLVPEQAIRLRHNSERSLTRFVPQRALISVEQFDEFLRLFPQHKNLITSFAQSGLLPKHIWPSAYFLATHERFEKILNLLAQNQQTVRDTLVDLLKNAESWERSIDRQIALQDLIDHAFIAFPEATLSALLLVDGQSAELLEHLNDDKTLDLKLLLKAASMRLDLPVKTEIELREVFHFMDLIQLNRSHDPVSIIYPGDTESHATQGPNGRRKTPLIISIVGDFFEARSQELRIPWTLLNAESLGAGHADFKRYHGAHLELARMDLHRRLEIPEIHRVIILQNLTRQQVKRWALLYKPSEPGMWNDHVFWISDSRAPNEEMLISGIQRLDPKIPVFLALVGSDLVVNERDELVHWLEPEPSLSLKMTAPRTGSLYLDVSSRLDPINRWRGIRADLTEKIDNHLHAKAMRWLMLIATGGAILSASRTLSEAA